MLSNAIGFEALTLLLPVLLPVLTIVMDGVKRRLWCQVSLMVSSVVDGVQCR